MYRSEDENETVDRSACFSLGALLQTHNRRYPSLTIHLSNLSRKLRSLGLSPLISPDINILVSGGHRARSDPFDDP